MTLYPLLKIHQVIGDHKRGIQGYVPVSRSAWYAGIKAGLYPQGVKLGQRSIAWRYSDIAALLERLGGEA
jgi:predicted DNA-binding transcriptional regulator AlpA